MVLLTVQFEQQLRDTFVEILPRMTFILSDILIYLQRFIPPTAAAMSKNVEKSCLNSPQKMAERTAEDSLKLHQVLVLQMLRDRVPPAELLSMSCPTSSQKNVKKP